MPQFCLLYLLALTGAVPAYAQADATVPGRSPAEEVSFEHIRFFREVHAEPFPGVYHALARLSYNGSFVLLVETDAAQIPLGDTLLTWVQHHDAERAMAKQADWADLIISCYPELLSEAHRARHVLPEAREKVWTYFLPGRALIVSDKRHRILGFALKKTPAAQGLLPHPASQREGAAAPRAPAPSP